MKNFEHPEFLILQELQEIRAKHPDIAEIAALEKRVQEIINQNSVAVVQMASLYTLLGRDGNLYPETREKLASLFETARRFCKPE